LPQLLNELEHHYRTVELPRVRGQVRAFVEEMGEHGKCIRLLSLYEQLLEAKDDLKDRYRRYEESYAADHPYVERAFIASFIPDDERRIEKLQQQLRAILAVAEGKDRRDLITPEMIENVLCIAHDEKHPSMSLKGNKARCFACGYYGDSIDVYQKINQVSFLEAVRALQ
jgi:hypothetical protein